MELCFRLEGYQGQPEDHFEICEPPVIVQVAPLFRVLEIQHFGNVHRRLSTTEKHKRQKVRDLLDQELASRVHAQEKVDSEELVRVNF